MARPGKRSPSSIHAAVAAAAAVARRAAFTVLALLALPYLLVPLYAFGKPVSTVMLWRKAHRRSACSADYVPLPRISPALALAVIVAEDGRFCSAPWRRLRRDPRSHRRRRRSLEDVRGGSTITQQVAKNLFLWPGRSWLRKALEFPLALWIDLVLSKRRILEIYLNIAEWGPNGEFGVEAGSRYAFGKPARDLSRYQAALLAAVLPNPVGPQRACARARFAPAGRALCRPLGAGLAGEAGCLRGTALALAGAILYKPAFKPIFSRFSRSSRPMAVPKRKTSPSRRGMRRSADALKQPTYVEDKDSGELRRPHHIDLKTGMYKGRQVLKVKTEA